MNDPSRFCLERRRFRCLLATSCSIGQPLAASAHDREGGALDVVYPELDPVGVAEIELGQVAVKVGFADVEIHTVNAPLQDGEVTLVGGGAEARLTGGEHCPAA